MNSVDIGKYKRIVQYFWDPEPRNDEEPDAPIWCLGREYVKHVAPLASEEDASKLDNDATATMLPDSRIPRFSDVGSWTEWQQAM